MAERKSGPVKPPVLDLKARQTKPKDATGKPDAGAAASSNDQAAPSEPAGKPAAASGSAAAGAKDPAASARPPEAGTAGTSGDKSQPGARESKPGSGAASATPKPDAPKSPPPGPPPRPQARLAMPWSAISIATLGGALLAVLLVYLLATWLPLPNSAAPIADPAPQLAALDENDAALQQRLADLEERAADTQISLDATIAQLDSGLAGLRSSLEELREAMPAPVDVELSGITAQLQTLESRLDATAAGASSSDAAALADSLATIEETLAGLGDRVGSIEEQLETTEAEIAEIDSRLSDFGSSLTAQTSSLGGGDVTPSARLPLIVSGLDTAFDTGRPYAVELQSLTALLPDLPVPSAIAAASESGLPRPDLLVRRFHERLPDILAGRTATATGDWSEGALEWAKALLALRPAEEMEGDSPEAVISRLEAAMERGDFVAAAGLLAELPAPMRDAAGPLADDILLHAEADTFITGLRAQALAPPPLEAPQ